MKCSLCDVRDHCLLRRLAQPATRPVIKRTPLLDRASRLFNQGDALTALYVVRRGCVKTTFSTGSAAHTRVSDFCFPGDALGVDALPDRRHQSSAVLLEHSAFCCIRREELDTLLNEWPHLYRELLASSVARAQHDQALLATLVVHRSERRLAGFLMYLRHKQARRATPSARIDLPMTRMDIASYLGMRIETVSRALGKLEAGGAIHPHRNWIELRDEAELQRWATETQPN